MVCKTWITPSLPNSNSKKLLPLSQFVCPLFYFGMSQNIVKFLKIKVISLLMFLLYPYFIFKTIFLKKITNILKNQSNLGTFLGASLRNFFFLKKLINLFKDSFVNLYIFFIRQTRQ